jgi:hypothetical protein
MYTTIVDVHTHTKGPNIFEFTNIQRLVFEFVLQRFLVIYQKIYTIYPTQFPNKIKHLTPQIIARREN